MKLHLLNRSSKENNSFTIAHHQYPNFLKVWHYHPELELSVLLKSSGTRFIGDSIGKFVAGEVVLIGKNLPHMWLNDEAYFDTNSGLQAEAIVIHFNQEFLGVDFFDVPEMQAMSKLFLRAQQGVHFLNVEEEVLKAINNLIDLGDFEKTIQLLTILQALAKHKSYALLSSPGFANSFNQGSNKELDKIYEYVFKNFNHPIHSKDVAEVVHMNPSSFSRFFKRTHQKTFTRYLNEIRVGFACKMLIEDASNITAICYESGFSNVSNFNRQFKAIKGMTPSVYVESHKLG